MTILILVALGRLAVGLDAVGQRQQVDYEEPIIYAQAERFIDSKPLYQPLDRAPYTVTAYTPLYIKLVSELRGHLGEGFAPGRAVSLLAALATTMGVAWLTARYARSIWAGGLAAAMFLALGFGGSVPFFGLYRVDLLAELLSFAAILTLYLGTRMAHVVLAAALAGAAILTKQTYFAAALAGTVWLWRIERPKALLFGGTAAALAVAVCAAEQATTGAFVANAISANAANPINFDQFGPLVEQFQRRFGLALAMACVYVARERAWHIEKSGLLVIYWVASALQLIGLAKYGAVENYWIEFAAPTAILASLGIWCVSRWTARRGTSRVLLWVFALNLVVIAPTLIVGDAQRVTGVSSVTGEPPDSDADFQGLVDLVGRQPGGVLADPLDVVVLAGRPVLLEPVAFAMLDTQKLWDPQPLVRSICSGQVTLVIVRMSLEQLSQFTWNGMPWWPPEVTQALLQKMRFDSRRDGRLLYVPAENGVGAGAPTGRSEC